MKMGKRFSTFVPRFYHSQLPKGDRHYRRIKLSDFDERFIKEKECKHITGLSRATRYRWYKANKFPAPIRLSGRITVWRLSEIMQWIEQNCAQSRTGLRI
jgi:prophage regulatory protein